MASWGKAARRLWSAHAGVTGQDDEVVFYFQTPNN
jgi:hypothetical protein